MLSQAKSMQRNSKTQAGSIVVFIVLLIPMLLALMGIAIDMGKLFVVRSELQNAADACALSAAYELDGAAGQFTRAETAGMNTANANRVYFQNNNVVTTANQSVQFSTTAGGPWSAAGAAPANAGFVRCTTNRNNIANWFIQILGLGNPNAVAQAVASNVPGQQTCALPIGVCDANVPANTPRGTWLRALLSPPSGALNTNGNNSWFRWIDFDPPAGGANELAQLLSGANACAVNPNGNVPIEQFGNVAAARDDYNSRFGIRRGNSPQITSSVPDYSGFGYHTANWPAQFNAYADYAANRRPNNSAYQGINGITLNGNPTILTPAQLAAQGRDRRVAVAPVINCNTATIQRWACVFLLHPLPQGNNFTMFIEYLGSTNDAGSPCKTFNFAGPANGAGPRVTALVR